MGIGLRLDSKLSLLTSPCNVYSKLINADLMVKDKKAMTNVKDVLHKNLKLPLITYNQS